MCNDHDHHLTPEELTLLAKFRELDTKGQRHVMLAIESIKNTADQRRNPFAF